MVTPISKFTLPKSNRLRSQQDFKLFFEQSKFRTLGSVKLFYAKSNATISPRLGISISGKYFNSVQRNSLKRAIREYFRTSKNLFLLMDVVVTVRYSKDHVLTWGDFLKKVKLDLSNILISLAK